MLGSRTGTEEGEREEEGNGEGDRGTRREMVSDREGG
jgi:hypothetical protein